MNTTHLTEAQLQLYVDGMELPGNDLKKHMAHCPHCQIKAENYRLINSSLKVMHAPIFDFDLAGVVLASVAVKSKKMPIAWVPLIAAITGALLVVIMVSLYIGQIFNWFLTLPKAWGYVLTVPVLVFLTVQSILSVTEHQRKMNLLPGK